MEISRTLETERPTDQDLSQPLLGNTESINTAAADDNPEYFTAPK